MEATQTAENGAFLQAKSDDEAAIGLLVVASGHLSAFYKNEGIDQGEIQGSVQLLQKAPEFDVSEDSEPQDESESSPEPSHAGLHVNIDVQRGFSAGSRPIIVRSTGGCPLSWPRQSILNLDTVKLHPVSRSSSFRHRIQSLLTVHLCCARLMNARMCAGRHCSCFSIKRLELLHFQ